MDASQAVTFRDYLRVYFRHKAIMLLTFTCIVAVMLLAIISWTPVYEAQATLLITAQKKIEASYYTDAGNAYGIGESTVALTQSEIVASNPVLERAVRVLGLYKRPRDYEKQFASPFKVKWLDQMARITKSLRWRTKNDATPAGNPREIAVREAIEDLRENIDITPVKNTNLLLLTVRDYDPAAAARIANVISRSYIIFDLEQQLAEYQLKYGETHQIVQQLSADVDRLISRLLKDPRTNSETIGPASVKIIAPATTPVKPKKFLGKKRSLFILLVCFLAAFASVSLAMVLEFLDPRFKSPREIKAWISLPYLGFVLRGNWITGKIVRRFTRLASLNRFVENMNYTKAYRRLSDRLHLLIAERKLQTILLTSTLSDEGADAVAANLGLLFSTKFSLSTLIIDANLRKPSLHRLFKRPAAPGLAEVLDGKETLASTLKEVEPNLKLLCAGSASGNPMLLLGSSRMAELVQQAKKDYTVVLIFAPHALEYKDAEVLAACADAGLYIVSEGKTRRQVVKHALDSWGQQTFNWLGVILTNRRLVIPGIIYKWT